MSHHSPAVTSLQDTGLSHHLLISVQDGRPELCSPRRLPVPRDAIRQRPRPSQPGNLLVYTSRQLPGGPEALAPHRPRSHPVRELLRRREIHSLPERRRSRVRRACHRSTTHTTCRSGQQPFFVSPVKATSAGRLMLMASMQSTSHSATATGAASNRSPHALPCASPARSSRTSPSGPGTGNR